MGVPALFRWLSKKYPKITTRVIEEQPREINDVTVPVDITKPNPNKEENDYLYLDMNNIIHPCCKPEGKPPPETEEEMFMAIFEYIERIVNMVRPRKLLYMAIDGVAPRAKMNQQRSRRFKAAQEAKEKAASEAAAWEELTPEMKALRPEHDKAKKFDGNCITPGTPFMVNLAKHLRYWIAKKLNEDPGWLNLKVILSDGSVPGEGEHKMMNFIRAQRSTSHHNPNTTHVIYGLDADLIMLALGTHEPYFKVLREDVFFQEGSARSKCFICNQPGHIAAECQGVAKVKSGEFDEKAPKAVPASQKPYIFLNVSILREYLEVELKVDNLPFEWDLEKAVDDWIFLCFFVGNDFLPHLPSLETREGAIDVLIDIWKHVLPLMGGFLTDNGDVNLKRAQLMLAELGKKEDSIFQERREKEERRKRNQNKRRKFEDEDRSIYASKEGGQQLSQAREAAWNMPAVAVRNLAEKKGALSEVAALNKQIMEEKVRVRTASNHAAAAALKAQLLAGDSSKQEEADVQDDSNATTEDATVPADAESIEQEPSSVTAEENVDVEMSEKNPLKRTIDEVEGADEDAEEDNENDEDEDTDAVATPTPKPEVKRKTVADDEEPEDNIRLWEPEYKERYYRNKFHIELSDAEARREIVRSYVEGCCWVMKYYMQGCPSWQWYYPYHYSPFASDFVDIADIEIKFELGVPFHPIEQLMGVLPAASKQHIPPTFQPLMYEEDSPIIDFYPEDFELDLNGKKYAWQGVVLLPFIDSKRLLSAMEPLYSNLTEDEKERNRFGKELLYVSEKHKLYDFLCAKLYSNRGDGDSIPLDYKLSGRLLGLATRDPMCIPRSSMPSPLVDYGMEDIPVDKSISVIYQNPALAKGWIHHSTMLKGVNPPRRVLTHDDIQWIRNGGGAQHNGRRGYNERGGFRGGRGGGFGHQQHGGRGGYSGDRGNFGGSYGNDRTYPGQSFNNNNGNKYGGGRYNNNSQGYGSFQPNDGSRFPRQDPYQGYDNRSNYGRSHGGNYGGRGGYDGGSGGYGYNNQGGHQGSHQGGSYGGHQGGNYGGQGYGSGGYGRGGKHYQQQHQSHQQQQQQQPYGGHQGYGNKGSGYGGYGNQGYNNQGGYNSGHQQQGYGNAPRGGSRGGGRGGGYAPPASRYQQNQPPAIPGFTPVNHYQQTGAVLSGILPPAQAPQAPAQGWYGHAASSGSGGPPQRGGRGGYGNKPQYPYSHGRQ
ncbi:5'-3' exoribonuclease 2 [Actinomortierella ambigua]|nr:5'-3' exoribonuclease 2 [Actinomortierella ambigua]